MINFENEKVIPVVNFKNVEDVVPTLKAIIEGGINIVELTLREENSMDLVKYAIDNFPDMVIGVGTVLTLKQAKTVIEYGAKFVVSPVLVPDIAIYSVSQDIRYVAGCVTPTEVYSAMTYGLDIVKFFPSELYGGVKTIKAISQVFKNMKFMPTGGISLSNLEDYFEVSNVVSCGGTWLANAKMIVDKDYEGIKNACILAHAIANRK